MNHSSVNISSEEAPSTANATGVGLLKKAFQILDLFADERPTWTQAELARETGLARSTLSRLVRFLHASGYLMEQRGRYTLGFAAIDLGRRAQLQFDLVGICQSFLEELAQATAETIILTGYDEAHASVVCLAQIPSRQGGLRVFENIGTSYPLHSGATAKAVLAFLPSRQISEVLAGDLT
ncbi:MAG: helix-turn-helix domain-containing protein, partial [bacterium]|nr:helix-turn-helix domain-containing protein [bacterium]